MGMAIQVFVSIMRVGTILIETNLLTAISTLTVVKISESGGYGHSSVCLHHESGHHSDSDKHFDSDLNSDCCQDI